LKSAFTVDLDEPINAAVVRLFDVVGKAARWKLAQAEVILQAVAAIAFF
jgi:hypothetical protein